MYDEYVSILSQRFNSAAHMAGVVGVSVHTIWSWKIGRRKPRGPERRMLQVLGRIALDCPELFAAIAGDPWQPPIVKLPQLAPIAPVEPVTPRGSWSDEFWYSRTVIDRDDTPTIEFDPRSLGQLNEKQEVKFWESCKAYEQRTGRIFPY